MRWSTILFPVIWLWRPTLFFLLILFTAAAYLLIVFNLSYSSGDRAGYLQKFSKKGWICKTYEGELAMTTVPGVAPILWNFTVSDESVAQRLSETMGRRVVLHYKEFRYLPTTCFGDTPYFVERVEVTD